MGHELDSLRWALEAALDDGDYIAATHALEEIDHLEQQIEADEEPTLH